MSKKTKKSKAIAPPPQAGALVATVHNDITIPFFSGVLQHADDTLIQRGGGLGLKIYDEIERDTHANAVLQKRKKALVARAWDVEPASEEARDVKAADLVRAAINALPFDQICEDLLDATLKGFSVAEIVWAPRPEGLLPASIVSHDQRRFRFDRDWRLRLLTWGNMQDGIELPERKFIVHRFGVKGNNPYGLGLGSRLFWPVLFKREGIAFWLHFLEKFAGPTVVGKSPYDGLSETQNRLLNSLREIRTSSAVVIPVGADVEFLEASRTGSVTYEQFLTYWDKQISIGVTGETLTTDIGNAGSRAASETHAEVFEMLVDGDADLLSSTLRETLARWIVDLNMPGARPPNIWRPRPENELELARLASARAAAAKTTDGARRDVLGTIAWIEDPAVAREILVASGLVEGLSDAAIDHLVEIRGNMRREPGGDGTGSMPSFAEDPQGSKKKSAAPDTVGQITELLLKRTARHFQRRLADLRKTCDVASIEEVSRNIVELAARWSPATLSREIGDALELAALAGRDGVFDEVTGAAGFALVIGGKPFREQIDFLAQKHPLATSGWKDLLRGGHDRAFVIAGVTDRDMLDEFHNAIIRAAETLDIKEFGKEADRIAAKFGWDFDGDSDHRVRTIFETNVRTSYMAGRLKQMRDPDVVKLRPFWRYVHADTRVPITPRPEHVSWDGLILRWDDPWWDTHFPPNGWFCTCGVETLSQFDLDRMGKKGPDQAPVEQTVTETDPETGETRTRPKGIGFGWDYMPGDLWERGLVPSGLFEDPDAVLTGDSRFLVSIDRAEPLDELLARAAPFSGKVLPEGLTAEAYAKAFLEPFGATLEQAVIWNDITGTPIVISAEMFKDRSDRWKIMKRGHGTHAALVAEAIRDPDEIWLNVRRLENPLHPELPDFLVVRRYIRFDPLNALFSMFELGERWTGVTGYAGLRRANPDWNHIDRQRVGKLLWKRK